MKKYVEINGLNFELNKNTENFYKALNTSYHYDRTLSDCYAKPSDRKIRIYNAWLDWFQEIQKNQLDYEYEYRFGVSAYNRYFFSVVGLVKWHEKWYLLWITYANRIAIELTFD